MTGGIAALCRNQPGHVEMFAPQRQATSIKAGDRVRTGDIQLGKLTLYQLSYTRSVSEPQYIRERLRFRDRASKTQRRGDWDVRRP
jgi:hypothetical protein